MSPAPMAGVVMRGLNDRDPKYQACCCHSKTFTRVITIIELVIMIILTVHAIALKIKGEELILRLRDEMSRDESTQLNRRFWETDFNNPYALDNRDRSHDIIDGVKDFKVETTGRDTLKFSLEMSKDSLIRWTVRFFRAYTNAAIAIYVALVSVLILTYWGLTRMSHHFLIPRIMYQASLVVHLIVGSLSLCVIGFSVHCTLFFIFVSALMAALAVPFAYYLAILIRTYQYFKDARMNPPTAEEGRHPQSVAALYRIGEPQIPPPPFEEKDNSLA